MLAAEIVHTVTVRSGAGRTEDRLRPSRGVWIFVSR